MKSLASVIASEKPFVVSEGHVNVRWGGYPTTSPQSRFRCFLCGHAFTIGDTARVVLCSMPPGRSIGLACGNQFVCGACDGEDVLHRIKAHEDEGRKRFWWMGR